MATGQRGRCLKVSEVSLESRKSLWRSASRLLESHFGPGLPAAFVFAPGRVNLIGEHIDYHGLPVLPIALERGIAVAYRVRPNSQISAVSAADLSKPVELTFDSINNGRTIPGDWGNYIRAAATVAKRNFGISQGIEAVVVSNLPIAAGLSSSSALLVAFTLALLAGNDVVPSLSELMKVLPDGEQFVGTRGGGMDHAAILASHKGCATYLRFDPFLVSHLPIPRDWCLVIADSLHAAEKSAALVHGYNRRRQAGDDALRTLGLSSYQEASAADSEGCLSRLSDREERNAFLHVVGEAARVRDAVAALEARDLPRFGSLLNDSHRSLRDHLLVSTPAIDALVTSAVAAGAAGARITGAGFGGSMVAVCHRDLVNQLHDTLKLRHYAHLPSATIEKHLFLAEAASGALEVLDG